MLQDKEFLKKFKKIINGREGEQYIEWKREVQKQINEMSREQIENAIERYKIRLVIENDNSKGIFDVVTQVVQVIICMVTIIASVINIAYSSSFGVISDFAQKMNVDVQEFLDGYFENLEYSSNGIMNIVFYTCIIMITFVGTIWIFSDKDRKKTSYKKLYFKNIIQLLEQSSNYLSPQNSLQETADSVKLQAAATKEV